MSLGVFADVPRLLVERVALLLLAGFACGLGSTKARSSSGAGTTQLDPEPQPV